MKYRMSLSGPKHSNHVLYFEHPEEEPEVIEIEGDMLVDGDIDKMKVTCAECGEQLVFGLDIEAIPKEEAAEDDDDTPEPWQTQDADAWRGN